jgi:hypothetical protein
MTRKIRRPATAVAVLTATLAGVLSLSLVHSDTLPPCQYEDGSNSPIPCKWTAAKQGNGLGHDVIVRTRP